MSDNSAEAAEPAVRLKRPPAIPRALLVLLGIAAGFVALKAAMEAKSLIAPTLLALTLVVSAYPIIPWLNKFGIPRWLGAVIALVTLYLVVGLLFFSLGYAITQLAFLSTDYQDQFQKLWRDSLVQAEQLNGGKIDFTQLYQSISPDRAFNVVGDLLSSVTSITSTLILVLTVMMFMVMDAVSMSKRMKLLDKVKPSLAEGFAKFATGVRQYWVVTTVFGLIVAVLDYFLLLFMSIPLALTWAVFSFVTNYIPNVGLILGMIPPALLALVDGGVTKMMWVIVAYVVINNVIQTGIQPKFTGDAVGITATVSFLSLVFWAYVLGPLGALLAVPMTLMVKTLLIDIDPAARWVNAFIASDPDSDAVTVEAPRST